MHKTQSKPIDLENSEDDDSIDLGSEPDVEHIESLHKLIFEDVTFRDLKTLKLVTVREVEPGM